MAMEIKEYVGHTPVPVKEQKQQPAVKKPAKKPAPKK